MAAHLRIEGIKMGVGVKGTAHAKFFQIICTYILGIQNTYS